MKKTHIFYSLFNLPKYLSKRECIIKILFTVLLLISIASCNRSTKEISINLSGLEVSSVFRLDTINTSDWDSLYILKPYHKIEINIDGMSDSDLKNIESQSMLDGYCSLLFLKEDRLVNYSFISRDMADFSQIQDKLIFPSNQNYELNEKRIIAIP